MFCSREFKVPMSALTRNADAQASLQEQFDRHKCEREDAKQPLRSHEESVFETT
jgi:hypothetical protein